MRWLRILFPIVFFLVAGARGAHGNDDLEISNLKSEMEQLRFNEKSEISSLKTELEQLRVNGEAELSSLKSELERLRVNKEADLSSLKTELERVQMNKKGEFASLKTELERLREEITKIREDLEKTQTGFARIQRLSGMDRYHLPQSVRLFGQPIPLHRHDLRERMDREFLLMVHDIPQVLLWMKRANRYFPFIQERLWNRGLPEDLKYVAIAESALLPNARSHARAVGLWQFISATGTRYGLRRTSWVDERRDPVKSTDAALAYLEDLYDKFGDWFLAVAAYNVGESHIKRRIKKQRTNSYFDLVLLRETERYVFRIAAAKVILSNPKKFGFDLPQDKLYQPLNVVRLEARIKRGKLDLVDFAQACGMTLRSFLDYNPHFRKSSIPRGKYTFYVLPDKKEDALSFIAKWNGSKSRNTYIASSAGGKDKTIHRVISGDSLWKIARKYQVYVKSIKEWNQLNDSNYIYPGQQLAIYR